MQKKSNEQFNLVIFSRHLTYNKNMEEKNKNSNFLGVMFECCNVYGRLYKNKEGTYYQGRCPKCMRQIKIKIGEGGTNQRFFRAY